MKPDPVTNIRVSSVSFREILITFDLGDFNGFDQVVRIKYRKEGETDLTVGTSQEFEEGSEPEVTMSIATEDLDPNTSYDIIIESDNQFPEGTAAISDVITVETRGQLQREHTLACIDCCTQRVR